MRSIKKHFLLDHDIVFLNHGSFGACPRPVFTVYQAWQHKLEKQPVLFLGREYPSYDYEARQALSAYLGANPDDIAFVPNTTHGVNIVARSLALRPGDEILTTDHEYGACDRIWAFVCQKTGARYIRRSIHPMQDPFELVEQFWQGVTPSTRLIYISHITSATALVLPVEEICRRARLTGILTLVDGAHAPGQIPVNLESIGADFYTGNCHKWMLAPKGSGFLHTRRERQHLVEPLVVGWGYQADEQNSSGSIYIDYLQWTGTRDPAAYLATPAAIRFMQENNWKERRLGCSRLVRQALTRVQEITGVPAFYPDLENSHPAMLPPQMAALALPPVSDLKGLKTSLYDEAHIEIPHTEWNRRPFLRLSVQAYNTADDIERLLAALLALLPRFIKTGRVTS